MFAQRLENRRLALDAGDWVGHTLSTFSPILLESIIQRLLRSGDRMEWLSNISICFIVDLARMVV
jgi:hypothetical protein